MGWPFEGSFVALTGLSATKSDSIDGHYVAQRVVLASDSVVQSAHVGAEEPSFTANIAVNKLHIRCNRAYQFVLRVGWEADED
jgi:hypothetical protein